MVLWFMLFCFFKQKTAYEMRISYWSSDVCSSDLKLDHQSIELGIIQLGSARGNATHQIVHDRERLAQNLAGSILQHLGQDALRVNAPFWIRPLCWVENADRFVPRCLRHDDDPRTKKAGIRPSRVRRRRRSEEHTSELQSLMRI